MNPSLFMEKKLAPLPFLNKFQKNQISPLHPQQCSNYLQRSCNYKLSQVKELYLSLFLSEIGLELL